MANFICPERKRIPENTHFLHVVLDQPGLAVFYNGNVPMSVPGAPDLPCTIFSNSCTPCAANGNQSSQRTKVVHARQDIVPQICPTFKHMLGSIVKHWHYWITLNHLDLSRCPIGMSIAAKIIEVGNSRWPDWWRHRPRSIGAKFKYCTKPVHSSRNCMYFIPESCSHDTLLTAFHGFIRAFKYGIGTLTCSNVLNQNLSLEKIYSIGVDG